MTSRVIMSKPAKKGFQLQQLKVFQKVINISVCVLQSSLSTEKTINQLLNSRSGESWMTQMTRGVILSKHSNDLFANSVPLEAKNFVNGIFVVLPG